MLPPILYGIVNVENMAEKMFKGLLIQVFKKCFNGLPSVYLFISLLQTICIMMQINHKTCQSTR